MIQIETFDSRDALVDAAADLLAERLTGGGLFVATGGSTPAPVYDRLAKMTLPWDRIRVTLSDDRWVAPRREESNERLVTEHLLVGPAARARFTGLWWEGNSIEADAEVADGRLKLTLPAAVTLLGMGEDGHVASLFPDTPELAEGMTGERLVIPVAMSGLPPYLPRLTLTFHALLQTGLIVLLVTGKEKRSLIERIADDPSYEPPAAAILRQKRRPVRVLWAA